MNIMVMAGTSDARKIIECISTEDDVNILATATTAHGTNLARNSGAHKVLEGFFNSDKLVEIIKTNNIEVLIDATHPFASEATKNAIFAANAERIDYVRFERPATELPASDLIYKCSSFEEALSQIKQIVYGIDKNSIPGDYKGSNGFGGKIFHLAGVNTLHYLTSDIPSEMIVARVLPSVYSIKKSLELGIPHENIVAMEGIFSSEFNGILMQEYKIGVVLTKESGDSGGTSSKIQAAIDSRIPVVVVMRPEIVELHGKPVFDNVKSLCDDVLSK